MSKRKTRQECSILVVEDDFHSCDMVARYLSGAGHSVTCAENGRAGLAALGQTMPDVIILDANMPEMSGVEFLEAMRADPHWAAVPVILLTGFDQGPHIERARALGVNCVFLKASFELADLLACVNHLRADPDAPCDT